MFNKKNCIKCGKKLDKNHNFCPYCGNVVTTDENWGLLGKSDIIDPTGKIKLPFGFNMLFNSLMKNFNKQFEEISKEIEKNAKSNSKDNLQGGISISISTSGGLPPKIRVDQFGNAFPVKQGKPRKQFEKKLSQKNIKRLLKLPKQESPATMKRISDSIVYEIETPSVKSIEDISIISLENSIEIKAIGEEVVYTKTLPINLPIKNCYLSKGKLVLELEAR